MDRNVPVLALAALTLLSGCGRDDRPTAGEHELLVVGPWEVTGIDPSRTGYLYSRMEVAETLLDADDAGTPTAGLATRWSPSAEGLVWTFTLRPGARFHDGTPVTPAVVAADLRRAAAQPGVFDYVPIAAIVPTADGVAIRLGARSALLPAVLSHYSAQILAPSSFDTAGRVTQVIGSGPYRMTSLSNQGFSVELARSWQGARPAITHARYLSAARSETRTLLVESGEADLAFGLDPPSLARLRGEPGVTLLATPIPRTTLLKLNSGLALFDDVCARRAISLAIDRTGIATNVRREPDMAATQLFPPVMHGWYDSALPPLATDVAESKRLLAGLGWRAGPDGILVRGGKRFAVRLVTYFDRPEMPLIATALQAQMRRVGIDLSVDVDNNSAIPAGHKDGTLQLALEARNWTTIVDPTGTLLLDYGPQGGDWGAMGWADPATTAALRSLASGAPPAARQALRGQVARTLQAELPVIPVMWYRQVEAYGKRVTGVTIDPLERSYRISRMRWTR